MKQLNWYQIFGNTHIIPDGKTVTPTDDIQILLHCANIWDKSYTTIGEVIADDDTLFLTLIDNNAIDYLVRSTTFASSIVASESAMQYIGASDYASETLLSDSTWAEAIIGSAYVDYVSNVKNPTMTSNTTPSGVASASSVYNNNTSYYAWKAFDNNASTIWASSTSDTTNAWVQYQFAKGENIYCAKIVGKYQGGSSRLKTYSLKGSNDGVNFDEIVPKRGPFENSSSDIEHIEAFTPSSQYSYYRLAEISTYSIDCEVEQLSFYGRENAGVQSWLKAGGITNKKYTTVSEVLSDLTTLATLMASSDAIDYLVTAKGWAAEICSDSNAMADIGMNNYAANTLLADETWRKAICNSTYFTSVLNVSVPIMTSNTQPYGVASASSAYEDRPQDQPYHAFDGTESTAWSPNTGHSSNYLQYEFVASQTFYKFSFKTNNRYTDASRVDTLTVSIGETEGSLANVYSYNPNQVVFEKSESFAATSGKVCRVTIAQSQGYRYCSVPFLQFYGRKDI